MVRGMGRALTDAEQERVAEAIVTQLEISNWKIEEGGLPEGHGPHLMGRTES
jgi:hypothetical protein